MPQSAVQLGAIQVIVSVVLLMSMASGRRVHAISCSVCFGKFQHLYNTRNASEIHVGMSPDCCKLGLGEREISIAAGTGPLGQT